MRGGERRHFYALRNEKTWKHHQFCPTPPFPVVVFLSLDSPEKKIELKLGGSASSSSSSYIIIISISLELTTIYQREIINVLH